MLNRKQSTGPLHDPYRQFAGFGCSYPYCPIDWKPENRANPPFHPDKMDVVINPWI